MKTKYCKNCNSKLIFVNHYEYDGVTENGSHEPYYECINGCEESLIDIVDTCTEFGKVKITNNKESIIL